jgi:predicted enzyme related to lactoylglutathione lyase
MSDRKPRPGTFVWFELLSGDPRKAQAFYADVLGWKIRPFPMGPAGTDSYDMIFTGEALDTMIGGFGARPAAGERARWISSVSVNDVDATAIAATAHGGTVLAPPYDLPGIARAARIADAQGAEIVVFQRTTGDAPDVPATQGRFVWNELHTTDAASAVAFCQNVLGYSYHTHGTEPYYVLTRDGVERAGITTHLPPGVPPHWLPYVYVDNVDATIARARELGGSIQVPASDIPGIGRFGVFADPTGAVLAVMKPLPRR